MPEIVAVNAASRVALTDDGQFCEMTNLFDLDGDDTDDPADAAIAVVKIDDAVWLVIDLNDYETLRVN